MNNLRSGTLGTTSRAVIPGRRLFNTIFGHPRIGKNITGSLGPDPKRLPPFAVSRIRFLLAPEFWLLAPLP